MLRRLWESGFAAGRNLAESADVGGLLRQVPLNGWDGPMGELFDLEAQGEACRKLGRWTFFVSSVPLKVREGVASLPNAVAVF